MSPNSLFVIQAATHLKGLAEKAKLNEKHVKIARIYKAKVATLTSERAELQGRSQHMSEEMERLKSDLKHTSSARARAESREVEVRSSLITAEGELREVRSELRWAPVLPQPRRANDPASSSSANQRSWSNPTTPTRSSPVPVEKSIISWRRLWETIVLTQI